MGYVVIISQEGFVTGDEGQNAAPFSDAEDDNEFKVRPCVRIPKFLYTRDVLM